VIGWRSWLVIKRSGEDECANSVTNDVGIAIRWHIGRVTRRARGEAGRISDAPRPKYAPVAASAGVDWAITKLAAAQQGMFRIEQAAAVGLTDRAVRHRAARGTLHRIYPAVYSLVPRELLGAAGHRMAAVLGCGAGAVLSHHSAAHVHGLLDASRRTRHDVTVPTRNGRVRRAGIRIHRSSTLRPCDVELVDGVPVTTLARTILDLADVLTVRRMERVLDEAVHLEVFDFHALREQIAHARHRGAARRLQAVLAGHRAGSTRTDGPIGERMLAVIRATPGLPAPRTQLWIDLGDGEPMIQADFAWPEAMVILETDGGRDHTPELRRRRDLRRDQRAARAGWHTLRVTWDQIAEEPARLGATLRAVVTSRWGSGAGTEAA
jgi:hypothetical protein